MVIGIGVNRFIETIQEIGDDDEAPDATRLALDQFAALERLGIAEPNPKHPVTDREYAEALVAATGGQLKSIARRMLRERLRRLSRPPDRPRRIRGAGRSRRAAGDRRAPRRG